MPLRRLLPLIIVCLLTPVALGQDVVLETPTLALRGIPFDITVRGGDLSPDSLQFKIDETTYPLAQALTEPPTSRSSTICSWWPPARVACWFSSPALRGASNRQGRCDGKRKRGRWSAITARSWLPADARG